MIIQCPECGNRYKLKSKKLGDEGVNIKCTGCEKVFHVSLPPKITGEEAAPPEKKKDKECVLVCDDTPFFREMVRDVMAEAGYTVEVAADGEEALEKVAEAGPDLLILDLQLPGISGFEVVKQIRSSQAWKTLPILAMSGVFTDSADVMSLEDVGADDYIGKDFKPEHLLKRVRNLLGTRDKD